MPSRLGPVRSTRGRRRSRRTVPAPSLALGTAALLHPAPDLRVELAARDVAVDVRIGIRHCFRVVDLERLDECGRRRPGPEFRVAVAIVVLEPRTALRRA